MAFVSAPLLSSKPQLSVQGGSTNKFASSFLVKPASSSHSLLRNHTRKNAPVIKALVVEIDTPAQLQQVLESAGDALVVIDYSTTWCGPCKIINPKFEALSDTYENVVFLKIVGDKNADTGKLMKEQGIRAVPAFHFWKSKKLIHMVNGAKAEALEQGITEFQ